MALDETALAVFESMLSSALKDRDLRLGNRERMSADFEWHIWDIKNVPSFRGRPAGLHASVHDNRGTATFGTGPVFPRRCHKIWSAAASRSSEDPQEVIAYGLELLSYTRRGEMPERFLRPQKVWVQEGAAVPRRFRNQVPIFQAIRVYKREELNKRIEVCVYFHPEAEPAESAKVVYRCSRYEECARVCGSEITFTAERILPRTPEEDIEAYAKRGSVDGNVDDAEREIARLFCPPRTMKYSKTPGIADSLSVLKEIPDPLVQKNLQPLYAQLSR